MTEQIDKMVQGFSCTVRGQYHAASGKDRIVRVFGPVTFFIPEYVDLPNGKKRVQTKVGDQVKQTIVQEYKKTRTDEPNVALWLVQRKLLPTWLAENHPDSVRFRTCSIIPGGLKRAQQPSSKVALLTKPVMEMTLQELENFCTVKNIPVAVKGFSDVKDAREAVAYEMELSSAATRKAPIDSGEEEEELTPGPNTTADLLS